MTRDDETPAPAGPTRRQVLKVAGLGAGAVLIAAVGAGGVRAGTNGAFDVGTGRPYELWSTWRDVPGTAGLVAAAVLAANPHNTQAWSFVVTDTSVDLHDDPTRAMPVNDPQHRERHVGYGCALANLVVAARAAGLDAQVTAWPDGAGAGRVAHVDLVPGATAGADDAALAAAVAARHCDRGPYRAQPVAPDVLHGLVRAGAGADVVWVVDEAARAAVGDVVVEATEAIVADEEMSTEAFSWFRSDRRDVERHRDGLTLDCQGLDGLTLLAAKVLPAQSREQGDAFWVRTTREVHTATAAAYGVVRVADVHDPAARLAGGLLLQHVHLAATVAGLGLQHLNQVTERIDRDHALGAADRFSQRWSQVLGIPADEALVCFRVGHPTRAANPSPRRPLADVTV